MLPADVRQAKSTFLFARTPSSPVVRIIPGPQGTLIAGFANGVFGIWAATNGLLMNKWRLHGPVVHMFLRGSKLYAASELGQHRVVNLGMLTMPYCKLLRQVWKHVPAIWESGKPKERPRAKDHRCARQ